MRPIPRAVEAVEPLEPEKVGFGVPNYEQVRRAAEIEQQAKVEVEYEVPCHEPVLRWTVEVVELEKLCLGVPSWEQTTPRVAERQEVGQVSRSFVYGPYFKVLMDGEC